MDIGSILLMLAVLIILSHIGFRLFVRFGVPGLIGEILVGIVIANVVIGDWSFMDALGIGMDDPGSNYEIVELFAELGVIFLLFSVGLETRVGELLSVGKAAMLVAVLGVIIPFVAGFALIQVYDGNMYHALFLGAALVATSVGITARVIKDMKLLDAKESKIIIGAAVIDDILGMIVLAIVVGMAESGEISALNIMGISIEAIIFVVGILGVSLWVVPKLYDYFEEKNRERLAKTGETHSHINKLIMAIILCLGLSWFADMIGLAAIIGAFLGGMLLADYAWEWKLGEKMESITTLFISFFFLNVGMQVNIGDLTEVTVLVLAIVVILLAIITKYVGCSIGAAIGDKNLDKSSRNIIGIGMIPRGEVGIIVASIGLASGAITSELYATVVIMAVATTLIAPSILARAFRKKYPPEFKITPDDMI